MDIVTMMRERNTEYLKLLHDSQNVEKSLSKKINDTVQEINRITDLYTTKIELVSKKLSEKTEKAISQNEEDVRGTLIALKRKKSSISKNEEQRQIDIKAKYKEILDELDVTHTKELKKIESIYTRQMQDNEEEYQTQLFVLNNSQQVSNELEIMSSDMFNKNIERQIKGAVEKQKSIQDEIDIELKAHKKKLKDLLCFSNVNNSCIGENRKLISLIRHYYEILNEIQRLKNSYATANNYTSVTFYESRKAEIDNRYEEAKVEIESTHRQSLKIEAERYEKEKKKILDLQSRELESSTSIEAAQAQIDAELLQKTAEFDKMSEQLIAGLKKEAEITISNLQLEKEQKLEALSREKELLSVQLRDIKEQNKSTLSAFLEKTKQEMDAILGLSYDYTVGGEKDLSEISTLPEHVCIGKYITKIDDCELSKALYGTKQIGYNNPIILDMRNSGNVIINASTIDENNESLYRVVCGLTMKYLEEFPIGALKVHFIDVNQHIWFNKFTNAFLREDNPICKQLVTNDSKIYSRIENINNNDCESIMRKIIGEIQDLFDLYSVDKTHAFHLFVIRSGFSEIVDNGNIESLRLLKNLMGERGTKCGIRFIIVNDYKESERTDTKKKQLLDEILDKGITFEFNEEHILLNNSVIDVSYIAENDAGFFIEQQCTNMAKVLANKQGDKILYEDIGFGTLTVKDKYSSVLSIPVGKFGTKTLEIPFNCGDEKHGPANSGYIAIGRTSSGKSSFFHSLVINGCMKYSPDDLQFWLLDFKNGGASSNYENANVPHIKLLSKNNKVDDAYCLFNLLKFEMDRRGAMLNKAGQAFRGTNFQDLHEYNECVDKHPELGAHMSRILVVIDEAQEMFSALAEDNDDIQKIGALIGSIAVRSRYVGIHMVMIVQNLSMGKSHILKDNFVGNIKGKVTFGVDESFLRESGFGQEFYDLKDEIKYLRQGESFVTCNDSKPDKVKMAYCAPVNFEKYFKKIRETYNLFDNKMIVIGNNAPLLSTDKTNSIDITYSQLLQKPTEKVLRGRKTYSFVFGEDAYSLQPAEFLFNSAMSCVSAIGSDVRILSSVCRSLLIGADNLSRKKIFVCNGGGVREQIFNSAIKQCASTEGSFRKYKMNEVDLLVKDVYFEYLRRKKTEEDEIIEDNAPIFVIINDITSISKIKTNVEYDSLDDSVNCDDDNDELSYDEMSDGLEDVDTVKSEKFFEVIENRNILDIIKEICIDGASVGVYFNFSAKNSDMYEIEEIFKKTSNKLIFNDFPADLSDANCPGYIIHSMLSGIRNDAETGETIAVSIINGVASKVRPILYKEEL